jgi:uncharacterized repeat protein (TIGR03803 family)
MGIQVKRNRGKAQFAMSTVRLSIWSGVVAIALSPATPRIAAQTPLTTLYTFADGAGGGYPSFSNLIEKGGDLYGAAQNGGTFNSSCPSGCGTIYKLRPPKKPGKAWRQTVLYSFQGGLDDGNSPQALTLGPGGVFYGMTYLGGANNDGTVFELAPPAAAGGTWTETTIYSFGAYQGDVTPASSIAGLVASKTGAVYGTAAFGGADGYGGVFELTPPSAPGGTWTETVIYSFTSGDVAGGDAVGGIVLGKHGEIYGAVETGGLHDVGFVYELKRKPSGEWVETDIHDFAGGPSDGGLPSTTLILDSNGALYGTTFEGGSGPCGGFTSGCGAVFKLSPPASAGGVWTPSILYGFTTANDDGVAPAGSLLFGAGGVLYGTTTVGGTGSCSIYFEPGCGTIFELTPPTAMSNPWTETILYDFSGAADGAYPAVGLVHGQNGELYGTTYYGGIASASAGFGTVYQVTP